MDTRAQRAAALGFGMPGLETLPLPDGVLTLADLEQGLGVYEPGHSEGVPQVLSVISVTPGVDDRDVVLGTQIIVTFNQEIDPATVTESTFSLTGPGQTNILTPDQMIAQQPDSATGREYITGTFQFALDSTGRSVVTFNPARPLQKDTTYHVLILGGGNGLLMDAVRTAGGEVLADSYEWEFTTGALNVVTPPLPAPLPSALSYLDPAEIVVIPRKAIGNDLATEIDLIFPDDIDPASVSVPDLLVSVEPILGDLTVTVPRDLTPTVAIVGRKITITIGGWPA